MWISGSVTSGPGTPDGAGTSKALLVHWNGTPWKRVAAPGAEYLTDIATDGMGGLWFTTSRPSGAGHLRARDGSGQDRMIIRRG